MSKGTQISNVIKRSVSFSKTVNDWAEELAKARGQENNFSAFIASLIHDAREREADANRAMAVADAASSSKTKPPGLVVSVEAVKYTNAPRKRAGQTKTSRK